MMHQSAEFSAGPTLLDFSPDEGVSTVPGTPMVLAPAVGEEFDVGFDRFQRTLKVCRHAPHDALCWHGGFAADESQLMLDDPTQSPRSGTATQKPTRQSIVNALKFDLTRGDSDEGLSGLIRQGVR